LQPSQADLSPRTLRLRVPGERAALERTRLQVLAFLAEEGLPASVIYRLELVLEEVLMNRLWHADAGHVGGHTDLMLQTGPNHLLLRFEDEGPAFDPTQVARPTLPTSIDDATPGGLGLLLTRKAVSAWSYERAGARNCFTLQLARA
jgi:anti-sigma regulatory factor (Ser/Thr protein kinase)